GLVVDFQVLTKRTHSRIKTGTSTIVMKKMSEGDVMNPDNLLSVAYSFKGKVWCRLEASKWANWCLQTHVISDIKSSFKFLVLMNGITLKKLIRKGISPVLKPQVCLSRAAKKKSIVLDIVNKCKQARHVEV
nr:hypothetical protein [Tanacetum cinerariifolium]